MRHLATGVVRSEDIPMVILTSGMLYRIGCVFKPAETCLELTKHMTASR